MSISDPVINSYSIYASMFSKGTKAIDSTAFEFDPEHFSTSSSHPTSVKISLAGPFELGEYNGWFVFPDPNGFSVPITLTTPPLMAESLMIIAIGVLTSIIMIELAKYTNRENEDQKPPVLTFF